MGTPKTVDITPFLDRWTAQECVFFEKAYSQSNGTFNSLPMILGGVVMLVWAYWPRRVGARY